ncbi:MAG: UpxY family transcription antiterminator [Bacteroidia bacterium]|nr:UpxY family transcription antiterminator [Bacteroidia bacterium]
MPWKVLYVASRSEKKINERLNDLGVECYVPLKKEKRKWSDRIKLVVTPLINGYVFVNVTEKNRDDVFKSAGVLNYVRYNGGDAVIREEEINALKSIEEKGYYVEGKFGENFEKGDLVKIKYGPFKGFTGTVKENSKEDVFSVQIESIGYTLTIKVPKEILIKK